jgi:hypothetical protein
MVFLTSQINLQAGFISRAFLPFDASLQGSYDVEWTWSDLCCWYVDFILFEATIYHLCHSELLCPTKQHVGSILHEQQEWWSHFQLLASFSGCSLNDLRGWVWWVESCESIVSALVTWLHDGTCSGKQQFWLEFAMSAFISPHYLPCMALWPCSLEPFQSRFCQTIVIPWLFCIWTVVTACNTAGFLLWFAMRKVVLLLPQPDPTLPTCTMDPPRCFCICLSGFHLGAGAVDCLIFLDAWMAHNGTLQTQACKMFLTNNMES